MDLDDVKEGKENDEQLKRFFEKLNERLYAETVEAYISMRRLFAWPTRWASWGQNSKPS